MNAYWTLVLPVKRFDKAKTRLSVKDSAARADLAHAFFRDTLEAVLKTTGVGQVIVVTDDPRAGREAAETGVLAVPDQPRKGLNAAINRAAARARRSAPQQPIAVLTADLPSLRPEELQMVLGRAAEHATSFLADHTGHGTTLLAAARPRLLVPFFEGNSSRNHRLGGAQEIIDIAAPTVRLDVDTVEELEMAQRLGVGPHTSQAIDLLFTA